MTDIAEKLDLGNRDFPEILPGDGVLGLAKQFREVLAPLFRFTLDGGLVIHHTNNGIGEEITTEQFIYFVVVLLIPVLDDYVASLNHVINGNARNMCNEARSISYFRDHINQIPQVKGILNDMIIVLQGESYWGNLVSESSNEDEEVISDTRCIARSFRHGVGGQCYSKKKDGELCNKHSTQISEYGGLCYGLITEPRPVSWSYKIPAMETAGTMIHWKSP